MKYRNHEVLCHQIDEETKYSYLGTGYSTIEEVEGIISEMIDGGNELVSHDENGNVIDFLP